MTVAQKTLMSAISRPQGKIKCKKNGVTPLKEVIFQKSGFLLCVLKLLVSLAAPVLYG